jgi:ubiquinone biosynthesis protein
VKFSVIRDVVRAKEIVAILLRYRFDQILQQTDTPARWLTKFVPPVREGLPLWRRVRLAIEDLGPTFIKIGQILSTRPDILPLPLIEELEQLRDNIHPVDAATILPTLEHELGGPVEEFFSDFDPQPVAAASIGQVYRARLKATGEEVAIKLQKPGLRKPIQTDLEILAWLAGQIHENRLDLRAYDLPGVVDELRRGLMLELDFTNEARNATIFRDLNQFPDTVFAPKVFEDFTTQKLIVFEWIDGSPVDDLKRDDQQRKTLAVSGGSSFFSQIVITGFFHGDPHPGNLLITRDNRICFLDWGLAGQLSSRMRYALIDLFAACRKRDAEIIGRIAVRIAQSRERIDRTQLEKSITTVLFKYDADLRRMENIGKVIFELIYVFGSHGLHLSRDYTLLAKAIISIERTSTLLHPDFNLGQIGQPYVKRLQRERTSLATLRRVITGDWRDKLTDLSELPQDLQRVLHALEDGKMPIVLEHRGVNRATNTIHHAFSRLSLAVIIGALIVGSSLVINTGVEPLLWGYPAIGLVGYLLSGTMGAYVAFDILRSGRKSSTDQAALHSR